ncbi:hypothetical protein [Nostoc sp. ATCC 53789]|uniref:hypothetical protein n=1 Tax=Nostoc sp. ATCC 53789 TaxID=76335 RepID=UPI000DEC96D6|nr:hypothetical protein [Nostoc sp. ATCC 53789]QHG15810.1 hypothetical protein GJB62_07390 [Nostoc sp. ATCC 53789]RCJ27750.1 hypothetical protein A6V25_17780 [Nostoc sp. ATCC 53789]
MSYCQIGDKTATVTYQFRGDSERFFKSNVVPINVALTRENEQPGHWTLDTYDDITTSYIFTYDGLESESPLATGRQIRTSSTNRLISADDNASAGNVRIRSAVFTPSKGVGYTIKVFNANTSEILFQDFKEGEIPPKYTVACGDGCPEGFCRCTTPGYPGYCCLDCNSTAASIRFITNDLKGRNG